MTSIRRQLTLGLLLGFALLLGGGGAAVYFYSRQSLLDQFDAGLEGKALAMEAAVLIDGTRIEIRFPEQTQLRSTAVLKPDLYECWEIGGARLAKSKSLGRYELPALYGPLDAPKFFDVNPSGKLARRAIGLRFVPAYEENEENEPGHARHDDDKAAGAPSRMTPPEIGLVVATDRTRLDQAIQSLGLIVLATGGLTFLATAFVVRIVLRRGLAPLNRLADQAGSIDVRSLEPVFPLAGIPAELQPICHRLNDLLIRLGDSFKDINEYAAKVSHELRTPLAILRLKLEQAGGDVSPELSEELQAELHQIAHVVEQSLLIARAEQGRLQVHSEIFDLAVVVRDAVEDFLLLADERDRRVAFSGPESCLVAADPKCVRQIVHNLLANALKHGTGEIRVKLGSHGRGAALSILNIMNGEPVQPLETLGLGLRVVDKLLNIQPEIRYRRRRSGRCYAVRLAFKTGKPPTAPPFGLPGGSETIPTH